MSSSVPVIRARAAAYERWSRADRVEGTAAARRAGPGQLDYWLSQQPTDLPDRERRRRAECAKKAHYTRLALASSKARTARREAS